MTLRTAYGCRGWAAGSVWCSRFPTVDFLHQEARAIAANRPAGLCSHNVLTDDNKNRWPDPGLNLTMVSAAQSDVILGRIKVFPAQGCMLPRQRMCSSIAALS